MCVLSVCVCVCVCVCVGSKLLLTKNLKQAANVINGRTGIVKDSIHAENETPTNNLLMYVIVNFDNRYTGEFILEMIQANVDWYQ